MLSSAAELLAFHERKRDKQLRLIDGKLVGRHLYYYVTARLQTLMGQRLRNAISILVLRDVALAIVADGFEIPMDDVIPDKPMKALFECSAASISGAQGAVRVRRTLEVDADDNAGFDLHLNKLQRQLVGPPPL